MKVAQGNRATNAALGNKPKIIGQIRRAFNIRQLGGDEPPLTSPLGALPWSLSFFRDLDLFGIYSRDKH